MGNGSVCQRLRQLAAALISGEVPIPQRSTTLILAQAKPQGCQALLRVFLKILLLLLARALHLLSKFAEHILSAFQLSLVSLLPLLDWRFDVDLYSCTL